MRRLIWLLLAASVSHAQVRYDSNAWTAATNVPIGTQAPIYTVPYAQVTICIDSSCANIQPVYNNSALTGTPLTQPLVADAFGRYGFWASTGTYWAKSCIPGGQCKGQFITLAGTGAGSGSVTSVGLSMPNIFAVAGSPITTNGVLSATLATQSANQVFAGPSSGSAAVPAFRSLTLADLPTLFTLTTIGTSGPASYSGGVLNIPNYATGGGGGSGTVTSVALTAPSIFGVSGSPISTSGTLALSLATQTAHTFFAGPGTGSAVAPTFRGIIPSDLPVATSSSLGAVQCDGTTISCTGGVISAPSAGSGISGQTAGYIPLAGSPTTLTTSAPLDYGVTTAGTVTSSKPIAVASSGGQGGTFQATEGTAATAAAGTDVLYADSTSHCLKYSANGGSFTCLGTGGGSGSVTSFAAPSASWPSWLAPTVTSSTTTPSLAVAASAIPNSALANPSTTVNGTTCTLGGSCTITGGGNTTSTSLTTNKLPKANGANSIIDSSVSDNGTTVSTAEGLQADHLATTNTDPYVNLPSNTTHTAASGDLWNNAGTLMFGSTAIASNLQRLAQTKLSSTTATVSFTGISQTYTNLLLVACAATTNSSAADMWMQFNGDTAADYLRQELSAGGTTVSAFQSSGAQSSIMFISPSTAPGMSCGSITIYNYTSSTAKIAHGPSSFFNGTATTNFNLFFEGLIWSGTPANNPITSIQVGLSAGSFPSGSIFTLYGMP